MTDEGSVLVKVSSDMAGYYHCLCAFHINQLAVRVSSFVFNKKYIVINDCSRELIFCFMTTYIFFILNVRCHELYINMYHNI